jgi:hypothetical protein
MSAAALESMNRLLPTGIVLLILFAFTCILAAPVYATAAAVHSPWDSQTVIILMNQGIYWPNDTVHITVALWGNFSNTLLVWFSIVNDSGSPMWQETWQVNQSALTQSFQVSISLPPDAPLGHYTVAASWDHRATTCDFWIVAPGDPVPVPELPLAPFFMFVGLVFMAALATSKRQRQ